MRVSAALDLTEVVRSTNVAKLLSTTDRANIADEVISGYTLDLNSRSAWEEKMKMALDLALQVSEEKSFPWVGAANVKFPLITVAALQFHARAYPPMVPGPDIVKCHHTPS